MRIYLLLAKVVRQIGNHNLGSRWNSIFGWTALLWWTSSAGLLFLVFGSGSLVGLIGDIGQRKDFAIGASVCSLAILSGSLEKCQS